jgi:hypothetical protein
MADNEVMVFPAQYLAPSFAQATPSLTLTSQLLETANYG